MTIHRALVKKVHPRTTKSSICMKRGCKVAFSTSWALQSPKPGNSVKYRGSNAGWYADTTIYKQTGISYWLGSAEASSIETTERSHE